jgi:hypothetical protein
LKKAAETRTFFQIPCPFFEKTVHFMHAYDYAASNMRFSDVSLSLSFRCVEKIDMHNPLDAARALFGDGCLDVSVIRPTPVRFHSLEHAPIVDTLVRTIHIVNNPVVCKFE